MKKQIKIEGMSCGHCSNHVKNALMEIEGVKDVVVNLADKNAVVEVADNVTDASMKEAIEEAGYDVMGFENI
ncbi:heavy-metal-associated domain-containing protein [Alkaliphilus hydrothermalis]|uniref:Copper ion binding protein n=1 Tax=Alkaliphilus hydrothermalis TaxID=1482730 RepID=A0ABS2NP40_9FIRM|nr:cation transporter [Alkaliphilus hydrothermalis]MBM7614705.1 copper ion binding protein [Alkaliphilus hydrothermalis]